jgi:hypothetical protein
MRSCGSSALRSPRPGRSVDDPEPRRSRVREGDEASARPAPTRAAVEDIHVGAGSEVRDAERDVDGVGMTNVERGDAVVATAMRRPEARRGARCRLTVPESARPERRRSAGPYEVERQRCIHPDACSGLNVDQISGMCARRSRPVEKGPSGRRGSENKRRPHSKHARALHHVNVYGRRVTGGPSARLRS